MMPLKHGYGSDNPHWRGGPPVRSCQTCGKEFTAFCRTSKQKYCCRKCKPPTPVEKLMEMARLSGIAASERAKNRAPKIYDRICKHCSNGFACLTKRTTCDGCRFKLTKSRVVNKTPNRTCDHCGKKFHRYGKKPVWDRVFCSYKCHIDNGGAKRSGEAAVMANKRYGHKKDANHNEIVDAFESLGANVLDMSAMGYGVPDLLVWCFGAWRLIDVKNPKTPYGRRGLNARQKEWALAWKGGPVYMVSTVEQAIAMVNGKLEEIPRFGVE